MSRKTHFVVLVLASTLAVGCVNASKKFEDFEGRIIDATVADAFDGDLANIGGEHFLSVHPNGSGAPLLVIAIVTNFVESPAGATADFAFQPLTVDNLGREETGSPLVENDVTIGLDGTFSIPIVGMLPGDSNPLTGQNIDADITLDAVIVSEDLWCGTATGKANQLVLNESTTFGAVRVDPGTRGADLPESLLACPETPPDGGMPDAMPADAGMPDA